MSLEISFTGRNKRARSWKIITGYYVGKNADMLNILPTDDVLSKIINEFEDGEQYDNYRLRLHISDSCGNTIRTDDTFVLKNMAVIALLNQVNLLRRLNNEK